MDSAPDAAPCAAGSPIRRPRDHSPLAAPPGLSQRAASFIASRRQGIHRVPFSRSPRPGGRAAGMGSAPPHNAHERLRQRPRGMAPPRHAIGHVTHTSAHTPRARHKGARARRLAAARSKRTPPPRRCRAPPRRVVGPGRLERPTSRLSGARSDRLSYGPGPADVVVVARLGMGGGPGGRDARAARPARDPCRRRRARRRLVSVFFSSIACRPGTVPPGAPRDAGGAAAAPERR